MLFLKLKLSCCPFFFFFTSLLSSYYRIPWWGRERGRQEEVGGMDGDILVFLFLFLLLSSF
ncbi:hypothetical protein F4809DRAFT_591736 [Biscogniauxia mediterranea]|nr:hypothetical protein F4809DRAFT_591736 [Biscogniauxia mediterranea]